MRLRAVEARVLGALVEKQLTTPQQYPLTAVSLVAACNQATNRDPVVAYDESTVLAGFDELKARRLTRLVLPSHGRSAVRYRHVLDEALGLDRRQCALLAVLLLRGPQTPGELRLRTERMADLQDPQAVAGELEFLASREEPLAVRQGRRPGQKEERWATPLVADPTEAVLAADGADGADHSEADRANRDRDGAGAGDGEGAGLPGPSDRSGPHALDPLAALHADLASVRADVDELRRELRALREVLGDTD